MTGENHVRPTLFMNWGNLSQTINHFSKNEQHSHNIWSDSSQNLEHFILDSQIMNQKLTMEKLLLSEKWKIGQKKKENIHPIPPKNWDKIGLYRDRSSKTYILFWY